MKEIFQALPEQGIAQVIFSDTQNILTNLYIDEILPRRRLASNSSNSSSSNVTYEVRSSCCYSVMVFAKGTSTYYVVLFTV